MTATEFLRKKEIISDDKTDLIIGFDNNTSESLIELLEAYHREKLKEILTEKDLVKLAQTSSDDIIANQAMKELRETYDKSYRWCVECDLAVVKESECCLNQKTKKDEDL